MKFSTPLPVALTLMLAVSNNDNAAVNALAVGDKLCIEGYIMDFFCIDRGTLLDDPATRTLEGPNKHSVHCLVDVSSCVSSPFEVLLDPKGDDPLYTRGWRLTENAKTMVVQLARQVGSTPRCSTCDGGGMLGAGYRAVLDATILDLNEGSANTPPLIDATRVEHSNDVEDPCAAFYPELEDFNDVLAAANGTISIFPISSSGRSKLQKQHLIHGSLMLIGWGFLLPTGTIFAKFFRHRPDGLWYKIHRAVQSIGLLFALIGWIIALVNFQVFADKPYNNYRHGMLGMTTMVLGLLQPINAVLRPHPAENGEEPSAPRKIWEIAHKTLGYSALMLAVATIGYGTTVLPNLDDQKTFQMAYGIGVGGLLFLLLIAVNVDKNNYVKANTTDEEKQVEDNDGEDIEEKSPLAEQPAAE